MCSPFVIIWCYYGIIERLYFLTPLFFRIVSKTKCVQYLKCLAYCSTHGNMSNGYRLSTLGATKSIVNMRHIVSKIKWECKGPPIDKIILKKKTLKDSYDLVSKLNRNLQDPRECGIGITVTNRRMDQRHRPSHTYNLLFDISLEKIISF